MSCFPICRRFPWQEPWAQDLKSAGQSACTVPGRPGVLVRRENGHQVNYRAYCHQLRTRRAGPNDSRRLNFSVRADELPRGGQHVSTEADAAGRSNGHVCNHAAVVRDDGASDWRWQSNGSHVPKRSVEHMCTPIVENVQGIVRHVSQRGDVTEFPRPISGPTDATHKSAPTVKNQNAATAPLHNGETSGRCACHRGLQAEGLRVGRKPDRRHVAHYDTAAGAGYGSVDSSNGELRPR